MTAKRNSNKKSNWWDNFSWGNFSFSWAKTQEEKRTFKKNIAQKWLEAYIPAEARINMQETSFMKRRKLIVNINDKEFNQYKWKEQEIIDAFDKIPYDSDLMDSEMLKTKITWNVGPQLERMLWEWISKSDAIRLINDYYNWKITHSEVRKNFKKPEPWESKRFAESWGWYSWFWIVGSRIPLNKDQYNKNIKLIKSKIVFHDIIRKEENLRTWKRINRKFINWLSYKPLTTKEVDKVNKKKLLIIQDCSGSMDSWRGSNDPSYLWASFSAACANSWVFDMEHIIFHSSSGWKNVAKDFKKWELYNLYWWAEWFEALDDNLSPEYLNWVDYIVVVTDLCIWSDAEQWLYDYLTRGKKHMILSFQRAGTMKGLNVRQIKNSNDMVNALFSLVS